MPPDQSSCTQATEDPDRGPLGSRPSHLQVCGRLWERKFIRRNLAFPSSSPSWVGSLRGRGEGQLAAQPPGGGSSKKKKWATQASGPRFFYIFLEDPPSWRLGCQDSQAGTHLEAGLPKPGLTDCPCMARELPGLIGTQTPSAQYQNDQFHTKLRKHLFSKTL